MDDFIPAPRVAIWRTSWLAPSETFILHQSAALTRWQPVHVGLRRLTDGLPVRVDLAPFHRSVSSRAHHRLSKISGYRFPFDRSFRKQGISVIHAHFGPGGITVAPIAERNRIPLIVTFHGFDVTSQAVRTGAEGDRYRQQLRSLFEQAVYLIAVSEFVADRLRRLGAPPDKIVVHHIGIPVPPPPPPGPRSGVVFVGRLVEHKGVDVLLEAHRQLPTDLRSRHPLRIAGFGSEFEPLSAMTRQDPHVQWLGRLDQPQVHQVMARSAVLAGPSVRLNGVEEAFGMVFLEAAANQVPVVASRVGGIPDAVADGETGLLIPDRDPQALASALRRVLGDPALAHRLGTAGRRRVLDDFDITLRTPLLEDVYDRAVREAARP